MRRFVDYLQELWNCTAKESVEEIDAILKSGGPSAALQRVREVALTTPHATPRFESGGSPLNLGMPTSVLKDADFQSWFRALQFARLIPYVVGYSTEPALVQESVELLANILTQGTDPSLALYAAVSLSPTRSSGAPNFLRSWESRNGRQVAWGIVFDPLDGNKPPPPPDAGQWQYAVRQSLLPFIKDNRVATAAIMGAFRDTREMAIKYMILEGMAISTHSQDYLMTYLEIMRDRELFIPLRSALLPLIERNAHLPDVRRVIDAEIVPSSKNPELRSALVRRLASFYPSDRSYADMTCSFVRSENEDPEVRTAAAVALTYYYHGQMHFPEYRDAIGSFLRERLANADDPAIYVVTKSIEECQMAEFIPVLEEIIREWRLNPPADDPHGERAACLESLENTLTTLREAGK